MTCYYLTTQLQKKNRSHVPRAGMKDIGLIDYRKFAKYDIN